MKQISSLTIKELFFKIKSKIKRFWMRHSWDPRPSSYPYISGDGFRKIADHIYDETTKIFDPQKVKFKDVIFVKYIFLEDFFNKIHPEIKEKYILISHNNDESVDEKYLKYLDDKIIRWYAQNVSVLHPKLIPLPIGLQNLYNYDYGITDIYEKLNKKIVDKKDLILCAFSLSAKEPHQQKERCSAFQSLSDNKNVFIAKNRMVQTTYLELLNEYKFVASPPGRGIDCHRTWEAMYVKTIPIVKKSILTEYFFNLGMPMWVIDDWDELKNMTKKQLRDKYDALKNRFDNDTIFMDYWIQKIRKSE